MYLVKFKNIYLLYGEQESTMVCSASWTSGLILSLAWCHTHLTESVVSRSLEKKEASRLGFFTWHGSGNANANI